MFWFLRDIDLLSVLARAAALSLEALLLGGVAFLLGVARPPTASGVVERSCRNYIQIAALALICAELMVVSTASFLLMSGSDFGLKDVVTTNFFRADTCAILFALGIGISARYKSTKATTAILLLSLALMAAVVSTSHAAARIDHRVVMAILTAAHHLGTAAWLGALPYLLISLSRAETVDEARRLTERYSRMALLGASTLVLAGAGLAWCYVEIGRAHV